MKGTVREPESVVKSSEREVSSYLGQFASASTHLCKTEISGRHSTQSPAGLKKWLRCSVGRLGRPLGMLEMQNKGIRNVTATSLGEAAGAQP